MCSCADLINEADWFILLCVSYFIIILVPRLVRSMNTIAARPHWKIPLQVKLWTCHLHFNIFNYKNVERESDGINRSDNGIVRHILKLCFVFHGYETGIKRCTNSSWNFCICVLCYSPCSVTVSLVFAETLELVLSLMKMIQLNFQNEFSSVVAALPPEYAPKVQQMFS